MKTMLSTDTDISTVLIPNTVLVVFGLLFSVLGNIIVMYIQWMKLKSSYNFRIFIPYLALSDLCSSIVCSAFSIYGNYHWVTWDSLYLCKIAWICVCLVQWTSISFLLVIAFQRYLKICRPYETVTPYKKIVTVLIVLTIILFESISTAVISGISEKHILNNTEHENSSQQNEALQPIHQCHLYADYEKDYSVFSYIDNSIRTILLLSFIFFYFKCGLQIHKLSKKVTKSTSNIKTAVYENTNLDGDTILPRDIVNEMTETLSTKSEPILFMTTSFLSLSNSSKDVREHNKSKDPRMTDVKCQKYRNINLMFSFITIIVIVTYTPRLIIMCLDNSDMHFLDNISGGRLLLLTSLYRLYLITYFVNPIVYSVMDKKFRSELIKLFRCVCCKMCRFFAK